MKELYDLIISLNKYEYDLILYFYSTRMIPNSLKKKKILKLFRNEKKYNELVLGKYFYNKKNDFDYDLLAKLKNDILNVIMIQESSKKLRANQFVDSVEVKKALVFSDLLFRRGLIKFSNEICNNGIELALKNELYGEALAILNYQRVTNVHFLGPKILETYREKVNNLHILYSKTLNAITASNELTIRNIGEILVNEDYHSQVKDMLDSMKIDFESTNSSIIGFWYLRAKFNYYLKLQDFENALKSSMDLLSIIENNRNLRSPVNIAGVNNQIGQAFLINQDYNRGITFVEKSLSLFNSKLNNYLLSLQTLFLAHFHLKNFETCQEILDQAFNHPKFREKKYTFTIWNYYKACLFFKFGHYKEAMACINQDVTNLASDRGELFFCHKVLFFQIQLETGKEFLWSYELTNFRKSMQSIKSLKMDRQRVIFRILQSLDTQVFDFPYVRQREYAHFDKLELDQYKWNPLGFELIKFEDWFEMKQNSYDKRSRAKKPKS